MIFSSNVLQKVPISSQNNSDGKFLKVIFGFLKQKTPKSDRLGTSRITCRQNKNLQFLIRLLRWIVGARLLEFFEQQGQVLTYGFMGVLIGRVRCLPFRLKQGTFLIQFSPAHIDLTHEFL